MWPGFAAQKNFAIEQATGDWILSLDADERVTPSCARRIRAVLEEDGPADGYSIPRRNIFWGAWVRHGGLYPDYQLRLFRRGRGRFVENAVHESVTVDGRVDTLAEPLLHHSLSRPRGLRAPLQSLLHPLRPGLDPARAGGRACSAS